MSQFNIINILVGWNVYSTCSIPTLFATVCAGQQKYNVKWLFLTDMSFMKINPGHGFYPICLCAPFLHILTLNFINDQTHLTENNPGKGTCRSYQPLWKMVLCYSLHLFSRLLTLPIVQQLILIFVLSLKKQKKEKHM